MNYWLLIYELRLGWSLRYNWLRSLLKSVPRVLSWHIYILILSVPWLGKPLVDSPKYPTFSIATSWSWSVSCRRIGYCNVSMMDSWVPSLVHRYLLLSERILIISRNNLGLYGYWWYLWTLIHWTLNISEYFRLKHRNICSRCLTNFCYSDSFYDLSSRFVWLYCYVWSHQ